MHQITDNSGNYTLFGVYKNCSELLDSRLKDVNYGKGRHIKSVSFRVFSRIVKTYMGIMFEQIIAGNIRTLYNKFGDLYPAKTLAIRYNPTTYSFTKENGKVVRKKVALNLSKTQGFVYFIFWNCPKKYRHYRLRMSKIWKVKLMREVENGLDVMDVTMFKYGRKASSTYIQTKRR